EKAMRLAIVRDDGEPQDARNLRADTSRRPAVPDELFDARNRRADTTPRTPQVEDALKRALADAAAAREQADRVAAQLKQDADALRARAEIAELQAAKARKQAEFQAVQLKEENERLKAALRDIA